MAKFFEEVLFTQKPGEPLRWHVVVGEEAPEGWDGPPKMHRAIRPDQLEAEHGLNLADVLGDTTTAALAAMDAARGQVADLEREKAELEATNSLVAGVIARYRAFLTSIGQAGLIQRIETGAEQGQEQAPADGAQGGGDDAQPS